MSTDSRAVILARVSSKSQEDEGYSLDSQVKLMRGYCESHRLTVDRVFKIAESASKSEQRRIFQKAMNYIETQSIKNLIVEKVDRHVRNLHDAVETHDWLMADENKKAHFVKDSLVMHKNSRSQEWLNWGIRVVMAKNYIDNLREEAMKGWAEKLAQGWLPAVPPVGYVTVVESGKRIHVPDKKTARSVQKAFDLYLQPDQSIQTIAKKMEHMGLTTRKGRPFSKSNVQSILTNPFYVGINRFNGKDYPGAQTPIIREETFKRVQQKMHRGRPDKYRRHDVALKGLISCINCGGQVTWQLQKGRYYGSCQRRSEGCKGRKYIRQDTMEDRIMERLEKLVCPSQDVMEWVLDSIRIDFAQSIDNHEEAQAAIESNIKRLQAMDDRLYDDKLNGDITLERYRQKHDDLSNQIRQFQEELRTFDVDIERRHHHAVSIIELSQKAGQFYQEKDTDEKREILIELFEKMTIENDVISVNYTKLTKAIAQKSEESRQIMISQKSDDRTDENDKNNRSGGATLGSENELRSIWLGMRDSNSRSLYMS